MNIQFLHKNGTKTFKTISLEEKIEFFSVLYPAADDELERFDSCLTGIFDGRLYTHRMHI